MEEKLMIKPTVGRVVYYRPCFEDMLAKTEGEPLAAIITKVWDDRMVNLIVFDQAGTPYGRTSIELIQPNDDLPEDGSYCHWMEYQIGQAAKNEELQAQMEEQTAV